MHATHLRLAAFSSRSAARAHRTSAAVRVPAPPAAAAGPAGPRRLLLALSWTLAHIFFIIFAKFLFSWSVESCGYMYSLS
jgi:hypothetical protein